jgi:Transglycosylase SLT domain
MANDKKTNGSDTPGANAGEEINSGRRAILGAGLASAALAACTPAPYSARKSNGRSATPVTPVAAMTDEDVAQLFSEIDRDTLARTLMLESGGNPTAMNPTNPKVKGAFQFNESTAKAVGLDPADRFDPYLSMLGAARLQKSNADALAESLGRNPAPHEVYLAHQQGSAGAAALLKNQNSNAIKALSEVSRFAPAAIITNGGTSDMTAKDFVARVKTIFDKADIQTGKAWINEILENKDLGPEYYARAGKTPKGEAYTPRTYKEILEATFGPPDQSHPIVEKFLYGRRGKPPTDGQSR